MAADAGAADRSEPVRGLALSDLALCLVGLTIWASNFVVVHLALGEMRPLSLATYRFAFAAFPAILFMPRPKVAWRNVAAFGVTLGVGQFGLLFIAMRASITAALGALVLQVQVFFTAILAAILLRERIPATTLVALAIAGAGLALIATEAGASATPVGLALVILAALAWASCNLIVRAAEVTDMLGYVAWSSVFAVPPLVALALLLEGPEPLLAPIMRPTWTMWSVIFWQSAANTLVGYGIWNSLLRRYPASTVAPMSLLVPVIALALSWGVIGEPLQAWKLGACALVLGGLAISQLGPRLMVRWASGKQAWARPGTSASGPSGLPRRNRAHRMNGDAERN